MAVEFLPDEGIGMEKAYHAVADADEEPPVVVVLDRLQLMRLLQADRPASAFSYHPSLDQTVKRWP
jgi:hypothetical protein